MDMYCKLNRWYSHLHHACSVSLDDVMPCIHFLPVLSCFLDSCYLSLCFAFTYLCRLITNVQFSLWSAEVLAIRTYEHDGHGNVTFTYRLYSLSLSRMHDRCSQLAVVSIIKQSLEVNPWKLQITKKVRVK